MDASWIFLVLYVGASLVGTIYFFQVLMPHLRDWIGTRSMLDDGAAPDPQEAFEEKLNEVLNEPPSEDDTTVVR